MMKRLFLLFIIVTMFGKNCPAQLWKQYADSARAAQTQRQGEKAIDLYKLAINEIRKDSSTGTWTELVYTRQIAGIYFNLAKYTIAESYFLESKKLRENLFGKEHISYANSHSDLALVYTYLGDFKKAEEFNIMAKNLNEKLVGRESSNYALSCNNLGLLYRTMGLYDKAEALLIESMIIREKLFGKQHVEYANSCINLGNLYLSSGEFEKAEPLYSNAKKLAETTLGKDHSIYVMSLNNLAIIYRLTGQFARAEPLSLESLEIRGRQSGKEHPDYAGSLNNLAVLYWAMGKYDKVEPLHLESIRIREKVFGKISADYSNSSNNLATFYKDIGQYEKAEKMYIEAREIREKVFGKKHPDYAISCYNIGVLYMMTRQYEKAESFYIEAKLIREEVIGKDHPEYAMNCMNLGILYSEQEKYEKAEPLFMEGKMIFEKVLGKENPDYASSCSNLGSLYYNRGQYKKAETFFLESQSILNKLYGKDHTDYTSNCANLAGTYWQLGMHEKALNYFNESLKSRTEDVKNIFLFASEKEKQSYILNRADKEGIFYSFMLTPALLAHGGIAYDNVLANRNMILTSSKQIRYSVNNTNDTLITNKYNEWANTREQLGFWLSKPIDERNKRDSLLELKADLLEKDLVRLSKDFRKQQQVITWRDIQGTLNQGEAAVEFLEFQYNNGKKWVDSIYYCALILKKDSKEPQMVYLFEKRKLDELLIQSKGKYESTVDALYNSTSLFDLVWKSIASSFKDISKIYFASSGTLNRINLNAVPVSEKLVLGDLYKFEQLNTTSAILDKTDTKISPGEKIILYGGVKFSVDSSELKTAVRAYKYASDQTVALRGFGDPDGFPELPYSEWEVDQITISGRQAGYRLSILKGVDANEESLKTLSGPNSPAVIHLSTHGKFFPDPQKSGNRNSSGGGRIYQDSDDPLMRSVILLAGANNAWTGNSIQGIQDGILTAFEISNLNLPNTKLVVLSACETGLGDIQGNEGVYGLQRSLKMAGVQNLIMSLWSVPDKTTAEFMQIFYEELFESKSISDAFYYAQTIMKNKYRSQPHKWAGLILVR